MEYRGLSAQEVLNRKNNGLINKTYNSYTKTYKEILMSHIFTLFNGLNLFLALLVLITRSYRNILFMIVVIFNTLIGIIQEIRFKKSIEKIKLLTAPKAHIFRDGILQNIAGEDIVLDDIILLEAGDQVLADGIILEGKIFINEAILTGEQDDVLKSINDEIYAGSYISQGKAIYKVNKIGKDSYTNKILTNIKTYKKTSKIHDELNLIIKYVSYIIIPLGLGIFIKTFIFNNTFLNDAILQSVAAMIGMIPEGLILLTSINLTLGILTLLQESIFIQELYALENIARLNVLLLDKTGTLTTGNLKLVKFINYKEDAYNLLANMVHIINDNNATGKVLKDNFKIIAELPYLGYANFSSENRYSMLQLDTNTCLKLGAYECLNIDINKELETEINYYLKQGYRALALALNDEIIALIILKDEIRKNVKYILEYLKSQGVQIKFISGDNPLVISNILKQIDYDEEKEAINLSKNVLDEDILINHQIFGRVLPKQKLECVKILKNAGYHVGMIGDGINDIMALKEADVSLTLNSSDDSVKKIADAIILDDDFSHLKEMIEKGRSIINNLTTTATLFLCKTAVSVILTILTLLFFNEYPYKPIQLTLISSLCIGFSAFILSLKPSYQIIEDDFIKNVFKRVISFGVTYGILFIIIRLFIFKNASTISILLLGCILIYIIYDIFKPLNLLTGSVIVIDILGIFIAYHFFKDFFYFESLNTIEFIYLFFLSIIGIIIYKINKKVLK